MSRRLFSLLLPLLMVVGSVSLHAQEDSVTVAAGPEYGAGPLASWLLGEDYRDLWAMPVRVEVLDLQRVAGGLRPVRRGGGQQTTSLRLLGADGREYVFRSVNKHPSLLDEPAINDTPLGRLIQDQVSSLHPASALVADPLLEAVGVLHVSPRLAVMPDDPALGEFREEFAGRLGLFEERPDEPEDGGTGFGGFARITGTERLLERLEESPEHRVDSRAYLKARLMDLLLGDWDRHHDQWRWAEQPGEGITYWIPIPRDRDYALVNYDGVLLRAARWAAPNAVRFEPRIQNVYGLTLNAQELDRRLLADLEWAVWDSLTTEIQRRLTDSVIQAAVARMPPEFASRSAAELADVLRARRDDLRAAALRFYRLHSRDVDVHATDEDDRAEIERVADGVVEVRLYAGARAEQPYFRRRFQSSETSEVRVYLHGGDDHAVVRGVVGESVRVRVIGGGGDDALVDSSRVRGARKATLFYDARGENRIVRSVRTGVSTRPYKAPERLQSLSGETVRDWGGKWKLAPTVDYQGTDGLIVGGGPVLLRYGFRSHPYAYRLSARAMVGLGSGNVAVDARGDFRRPNSRNGFSFYARASQLENLRFYGYGNDTPASGSSRRYTIPQDQVLLRASARFGLPADAEVEVGPVIKYTNPDVPDEHPVGNLPSYGSGGFGQVGARAEVELDRSDPDEVPMRGVAVRFGGAAYPGIWDAEEPFGEGHGEATAYLPLPLPLAPTLAMRAGGQRVWGRFPVHEAAFLGGSRTVRGYPYQRFAGDAMLYGNLELRAPLTTFKLLLRGKLGAHALADAGRVYLDGESPGGWHTAVGAGLWLRFRIRDDVKILSLTYTRGERDRVYLKLGAPF